MHWILIALMMVNLISVFVYFGFEKGVSEQIGKKFNSIVQTSAINIIFLPWFELYVLGIFIKNSNLQWKWIYPF